MAYTFKHGDRPLEGITIQRAVGRGGFGEVYYALSDSGKQVAVKYLRDNAEVELRGVAHVMNLKSPHLITIYDVRHNDGAEPFVIMEYVSGPSLRDLLMAEPGGLGPQKAAFFLKGIAEGLSYLHERGIVHRDLKPGNIFYDDGYVKIGDYGLSKHIAVSAHSGNTISVGTVHYMAPEIGSGSYTKSIDVYALGIMLYEMLTGRLPFTGSSMGEILMRHLSDRPDVSGIPEPFAGVIVRALAKDPHDRYQDVDEMVEAVTAATEISEGLASFDASVLAGVPRGDARLDQDRTVTTPPGRPPVPVLDAREDEFDLPPIPPIPAVLGKKAAKQAHKLQKKARKLQDKMEKRGRVVRAKLADLGMGPAARNVVAPAAAVGSGRWRSFVVALIVLFAVAGGLGIGYKDGVVFGASLLYLAGGTIGTLLAYALSVRRNSLEHGFQDRLLFAACGFVFMLPAFAAGYEVCRHCDAFARLIIPLTATLLIFNWTDRIQMGRRQAISGGPVFWHGVAAAIIAPMADAADYTLVSGILAGAHLILVQSLAALWPLPVAGVVPAPPPRRDHAGRGAWKRVEHAYTRVSSAMERVGERLERAGERVGSTADRPQGDKLAIDEASEAKEASEKAREAPQTAPPSFSVGYQPSFVGRTANAGLSFLAKLLLLIGFAVALPMSAELVNVDTGSTRVVVGPGMLLVQEHGHAIVDQTIPPIAMLAPMLMGTILLVVARRHDGAAHFLRGFLGCVLVMVAAVMAASSVSPEIKMLLSGGWQEIADSKALIRLGMILAMAVVLLFWPAKRADRPIVI